MIDPERQKLQSHLSPDDIKIIKCLQENLYKYFDDKNEKNIKHLISQITDLIALDNYRMNITAARLRDRYNNEFKTFEEIKE